MLMEKLAEKGDEAAPFAAMMKVHKDGLTADYESMRLMTAEVPPKKDSLGELKSMIDRQLAALKIDSTRISKAFGFVKPKPKAKAPAKAVASAAEPAAAE